MRAIRAVLIAAVCAGLGLGAAESEARRVGSTSSKSYSSSARHVDDDAKRGGAGLSPAIRASVAGSAAGAVAGNAAARALSEADKVQPPPPDQASIAAAAEQARLDKLSDFDRKAEVEDAAKRAEQAAMAAEIRFKAERAAKEAAEKRRQAEMEARQRAEEQRQADLKREATEREKSCVIKPAMSDDEIAHCKWAWSFPPP